MGSIKLPHSFGSFFEAEKKIAAAFRINKSNRERKRAKVCTLSSEIEFVRIELTPVRKRGSIPLSENIENVVGGTVSERKYYELSHRKRYGEWSRRKRNYRDFKTTESRSLTEAEKEEVTV